jgi:hypothetical protein
MSNLVLAEYDFKRPSGMSDYRYYVGQYMGGQPPEDYRRGPYDGDEDITMLLSLIKSQYPPNFKLSDEPELERLVIDAFRRSSRYKRERYVEEQKLLWACLSPAEKLAVRSTQIYQKVVSSVRPWLRGVVRNLEVRLLRLQGAVFPEALLTDPGSEDEYLTEKLKASTEHDHPLDDFIAVGEAVPLKAENARHAEGEIMEECRVVGYLVQATTPKKYWFELNPEIQADFHFEGSLPVGGNDNRDPYRLVVRADVQSNQGVSDDSIVSEDRSADDHFSEVRHARGNRGGDGLG